MIWASKSIINSKLKMSFSISLISKCKWLRGIETFRRNSAKDDTDVPVKTGKIIYSIICTTIKHLRSHFIENSAALEYFKRQLSKLSLRRYNSVLCLRPFYALYPSTCHRLQSRLNTLKPRTPGIHKKAVFLIA